MFNVRTNTLIFFYKKLVYKKLFLRNFFLFFARFLAILGYFCRFLVNFGGNKKLVRNIFDLKFQNLKKVLEGYPATQVSYKKKKCIVKRDETFLFLKMV